jgi:hypothetical protein
MAQPGKQMRVGARKGFPYNSNCLIVTGERLILMRFFFSPSGEALFSLKILPLPNSELFLHTFVFVCTSEDSDTYAAPPKSSITFPGPLQEAKC